MLHKLLLAAVIVSPVLIIVQIVLNFFTPGLGKIPGPFLARFSDLWRFIDACRGHRAQTMLDVHKKYGPVVRIGPNCINVSDPAAIEMILGLKTNLDKSDHVRPASNPVEGEILPMLLSAIDSKLHAKRRRPIAGYFSMSNVLGYEDIMDDMINKLIRRLREEFVDGEKPHACSIDKWLHMFSFDLICKTTFSKEYGLLDAGKDLDNTMATLDFFFLYMGTLACMPWLDYLLLKNPLLMALTKTPNYLIRFSRQRILKRVNGEEKGDPEKPDFLSKFLDAQAKHPADVSDLQLSAYAATNVLAASDTTGSALTAIILHILLYPEVLRKLQDELNTSNLSYPPKYSEAQKLTYMDAVIQESFRYYPTIGSDLERKVGPNGLVLPTGEVLPPGTIVAVNQWPVHRDIGVFGEDADTFRPERWLQQSNETKAEFDARHRAMQRALIEFGYGPRVCLGKHIAMLEVYKLIPTLFGLFDMSIAYPERPVKMFALTTTKITDFHVYIRDKTDRESKQ